MRRLSPLLLYLCNNLIIDVKIQNEVLVSVLLALSLVELIYYEVQSGPCKDSHVIASSLIFCCFKVKAKVLFFWC